MSGIFEAAEESFNNQFNEIKRLKKSINELETDNKNLKAVNDDIREGWDKTLEENIALREKLRAKT